MKEEEKDFEECNESMFKVIESQRGWSRIGLTSF